MTISAEQLAIETQTDGGRLTIKVTGEIDLGTAPQFKEAVLQALSQSHGCVRVDLTAVDFMDCSGVNVLIAAQRRAALLSAHLTVVASPGARRTFTLAGVAGPLSPDCVCTAASPPGHGVR